MYIYIYIYIYICKHSQNLIPYLIYFKIMLVYIWNFFENKEVWLTSIFGSIKLED